EPPDMQLLRKDVPRELVRVLEKMVSKQPSDRYQTPDDLIKDLELLKIDSASKDGQLPSSRSQIMNVISAEKDRIASLEADLQSMRSTRILLIACAVSGWIATAVVALIAMSRR